MVDARCIARDCPIFEVWRPFRASEIRESFPCPADSHWSFSSLFLGQFRTGPAKKGRPTERPKVTGEKSQDENNGSLATTTVVATGQQLGAGATLI